MKHSRWIITWTALILILALLAACGSDADASSREKRDSGEVQGSEQMQEDESRYEALLETILGKESDDPVPNAPGDPEPAEPQLPLNRYVQIQMVLDGEAEDCSDGSLLIYEDGSGILDFGYGDTEDCYADPDNMKLYLPATDEYLEYTMDGDRITVVLAPGYEFVFELEERGFDQIRNGGVDPKEAALAAKQAEFDAAYAESSLSPAEDGWYHISTPMEFLHIADDLGGKYILEDDMDDWWDGKSTVFSPIGTPEAPFTGELNGNGHSITGMLAYTGQEESWGLFGCSTGYIHDLTLGYISCDELTDRYYDYQIDERTYTSVDEEGLPTESTQYYGVLCGCNRGTIENITIDGSMPEMNLFPNGNEHICIGLICGRNEGTVSGVTVNTFVIFRSLDKYTAAAIGMICGYQTSEAVLENVSMTESYVDMDSWGFTEHLAPAVYAGLLIGEAEGSTTIRGPVDLDGNVSVEADYSLADQDLRLGGFIGWVHGDIELSGIRVNDLYVRIDARTDQEGYAPADGAPPLAGGGLIGWADGSVTLSDISMTDVSSDVIRREGGDPLPSYAGGCVAYCGGNLSAQSVRMEGDRSNVDAQPEQGDAYGGGLCGFCGGSADVSNSLFSVYLAPMFDGDTLYEANVLGYVCGNAAFRGVEANCGIEETTGESRSNSLIAASGSTYYLAALAGCAKGEVTVTDCVIDVHFSVMGNPGALYSGGDEGFYNPA